jgi:hypothetical protein
MVTDFCNLAISEYTCEDINVQSTLHKYVNGLPNGSRSILSVVLNLPNELPVSDDIGSGCLATVNFAHVDDGTS